jgi:hypothetical protein
MDPRLRKLRVALWILGLGTLIAFAWHGWQGWVLGRGYPDNSYVYVRQSHFTDWTGVVQFSALPTPYTHQFAFYFPATYLLFQPFVWLDGGYRREVWPDQSPSLVLYLATMLIGTVLLQRHALREIVPGAIQRLLAAMVLTAGSYAVVLCFERANVELAMVLLGGGALLCCRHVRFGSAALLLSVPIWLKLYPILLLALFLRRRHMRYIVLPAAGFVLVSLLALATFSQPISDCLAMWQRNMTQYNFLYMIADRGLSGSASPWNALKIGFLTADHLGLINLHLVPLSNGDHYSLFFLPLSHAYNDLFLVVMLGLVLFATLIEREFFRRAILFLLFISICAQAGADYKLLWVHVALVVAILLPTARRLDLAAVVLMALVLVPKKELYLAYLGRTDTTYNDVSFGVVANPLLILAALALLVIDGWRARLPGWSWQRAKSLAHQVMDGTPWRGRWRRVEG